MTHLRLVGKGKLTGLAMSYETFARLWKVCPDLREAADKMGVTLMPDKNFKNRPAIVYPLIDKQWSGIQILMEFPEDGQEKSGVSVLYAIIDAGKQYGW